MGAPVPVRRVGVTDGLRLTAMGPAGPRHLRQSRAWQKLSQADGSALHPSGWEQKLVFSSDTPRHPENGAPGSTEPRLS